MNDQMQSQSSPTQKRCPTCRKSDFTDFSTCRYCGRRYDQVPIASSNYDNRGVDPFKIFLTIVVVGSVIAVPYLCSQGFGFLAVSHHYGYFGRSTRPSMLAIPAALGVFAGKQVFGAAQNTIDTENAAIAVHGVSYEALIKRGDAYWTEMKTQRAIDDFTAAIAISPRSREAYEKRAICYQAMGNDDLAKRDKAAAAALH